MKYYEVVIRHESQTFNEDVEGWFYILFTFESENDENAIIEAKRVTDNTVINFLRSCI